MSAKKLAVSTYLQYIFIALCAPLLFVFFRRLNGDVVLLTPLFAAVLAALLVLIISGVGRVQSLEQSPATREETSVLDSVKGKR